MKKIKTLALAALPIATVGATAFAATSCNKNSVKTLSYDEAKEWVKSTWGSSEGKLKLPTDASTTWKFTGEITTRKTQTEAEISRYQGYFKNHIPNFMRRLGFVSEAYYQAACDTVSFEGMATTFLVETTNAFTSDIEFTEANFFRTITSANFDDVIGSYFASSTGKKYTKFTVDNQTKTMKATGVFYCVDEVDNGYDVLSMPDCTVSFGSDGQILGVEFNFGKYSEAEYIWYSKIKPSYSDWFDFTLDEGGKITVKFNYAK